MTPILLCPPPLTFQSDIKPDDLLPKGSRTKERSKEKKPLKDRKKGQTADGLEKRAVKAKVDELVVSVYCGLRPTDNNHVAASTCLSTCAGVQ